jgi:hypothetical protein
MLDSMLRGRKLVINGYNGAIINTGWEDLSDPSAALVLQAAAGMAIKVASSSANDVMTSGSGAWKVRLFGLSASGAFQTEDVSLNGQTTVASAKTWGIAGGFPILGAEVIQANPTGSGAAGNICVVDNAVTVTAGVSQDMTKTYALITAGEGISHNGFFQVPLGETFVLSEFIVSNRAQICDYSVLIREAGAVLSNRIPLVAMAATGIPFPMSFPRGAIFLPEKTVIRMQGKAATTGALGMGTLILDRWF